MNEHLMSICSSSHQAQSRDCSHAFCWFWVFVALLRIPVRSHTLFISFHYYTVAITFDE